MKESTFEYIWKNVIYPAERDVMASLPPEVVEKYKVQLDEGEAVKKAVFRVYDMNRKEFRRKYFKDGMNPNARIDKHKICVCLLSALMHTGVLKFDTSVLDNDAPASLLAMGASVALCSALALLYLFMVEEMDDDDSKKLLDKKGLIFPKTETGHDEYLLGRIKALAITDISGNDIDMLAWADTFFWIEQYNKEHL